MRRSHSPIASASAPFACPPVYISSSAALLADDRGQRHRDAEALVEPELGEVAAEAGVGGGDPEVGREREAEPAADRRALHRGDDRLLRREEGDGLLVEVRGLVDEVRLRAEVGAGAEVLALRAQHDRPAVGVVVEREDRLDQRLDERDVEEVVRRSVELDRRDVVLDGDGDVIGHGARTLLVRVSGCHTLRSAPRAWPTAARAVHTPLMFRRLSS